jgi:DNA invertase Pin-like site-specific DNA recombinase
LLARAEPADAKHRHFDAVPVSKLDRFGRSLKHLVNALTEFLSLGHRLREPQGQLGPDYAIG